MNVTTRNCPRRNTIEQQITKRKRAPNKPKVKMDANYTQTEQSSNRDRGRSPITSDPTNPIFPLSNTTDMPQYRKNLAQLFGGVTKRQNNGAHH